MIKAICSELKYKSQIHITPIQTIYFGGGTPSILNNEHLDEIFKTIYSCFDTHQLNEITFECNPDDLYEEKLIFLKKLGINRLSIGIQSTNNETLKFSNRAHNKNEALNSVTLAQKLGFNNITVDVIYGFPNENFIDFKKTVQDILELNVSHISAYSLTIEENTAFGKWKNKKKLQELPEDNVIEQYEFMIQEFEKNGYVQYEISNFAKVGFEAIHNSNYWKGITYIGIGPSAHSFDGDYRYENIANNAKYIEKLQLNQPHFNKNWISPKDRVNEYILTSLRTIWGCDIEHLKYLSFDILEEKHEQIQDFTKNNWLKIENRKILLTKEGKLMADFITMELFI